MKKTLVLVFAFIATTAFSQEKKVIAVTSSNDTIIGIIKDKQWIENPTEVKIKPLDSDNYKTYTTQDLSSFKIETGDFYLSQKVKIDITPLEFDQEFIDTTQIGFEEKQVFLLKEYSSNELNIYSYLSKRRLHIFIQKNGSVPEELIYRAYTIKREGSILEREDKTYITQLNNAFANCEATFDKIATVPYSIYDIVNLTDVYTKKCTQSINTNNGTKHSRKTESLEMFALLGITKNTLGFTTSDQSPRTSLLVSKNDYTTAITPVIGVRFNLAIKKNHERFSLGLDFMYNQLKAESNEMVSYTSPDYYTQKKVSIKNNYLKTSFIGRYAFGFEKSMARPYLQTGFTNTLLISEDNYAEIDNSYNNVHEIITTDPFSSLKHKKLTFGFIIGAGLKVKRCIIEYRYEVFGEMTGSRLLDNKFNAHTLLVGFKIF